MATLRKYGGKYNSTFCQLCGLSTDTKPTSVLINDRSVGLADGSEFIEMDTNKKYKYSADNATWYEVESGGGGGGSATLIDKTITANGTYDAANDGADGYKSVDVSISGDFSKITTFTSSANGTNLHKICIINPPDNYGGHVDIYDENGVTYIITKPIASLRFISRQFQSNKAFEVVGIVTTNNPTLKFIGEYGAVYNVSQYWSDSDAFRANGSFVMVFADIQEGASNWRIAGVECHETATPFTFDME